ncbi:MAG: aminopeptidase [Flavobacteriales bacterium]|nr:aminopeptidase [Flavobacteriales bacterium]|tara:strand:+ start:2260 stop:4083 length:1824 start_codon:yes stop_codon:yes gene_type:complete
MKKKYLLIIILVSNLNCNINNKLMDNHSFSRPDQIFTKHLDLDIEVDFFNKKIFGEAKYKLEKLKSVNHIILDIYNLKILKIESNGTKCSYSLGKHDSIFGQSLKINLEKHYDEISIFYETIKGAKALQWLDPNQTAGKKNPFLFTQSQAILARTWIPCQDSPGVRFTYNAKVKVPKNLLPVMSAVNPFEKNDIGIYNFTMTQPIPAYLMALSVGDLQFKKLGKHTGIYAEPSMLLKASFEFENTEKMLKLAEDMFGKYLWDRFDLLVLPPSFPFGGMENPKLTFVTPTILSGDRSLTSLIAHELAHSWSGNLVTNKTWDDFWLNEGFTVYLERRIIERLKGRDYSDMLTLLGKQDLEHTVSEIGKDHENTHLKLNLVKQDPDNGLTDIAYEKGFFFLKLLEEKFGRKQFDLFLNKYFNEYKFKAIDTEEFVEYLTNNLIKDGDIAINEIQIDKWIYGPGIPDNCPQVKSSKFNKVIQIVDQFNNGFKIEKIKSNNWSSHEWLYFLRNLPPNISYDQVKNLDDMFNFTDSGNSEILNIWFQIAIKTNYKKADKAMEKFLVNVGRRKFLEPIYSELMKYKPNKAKSIYKKARMNYHSVSKSTIDKIVF